MTLNPFIFRAYDIRGKLGTDITPDVFAEVGRAYGTLMRGNGGRTVALGMDNRTSSPPLKEAFAAGVLSTGVDVVDIGVNHTRCCISPSPTGGSTAAPPSRAATTPSPTMA